MSRFDMVLRPEPESRVAALYSEIVAKGFGETIPINWFTAQGRRPDILQASWGLAQGILVEGILPPTLKQMIAATVSAQNGCRYCAVTHTSALQSMGVPETLIQSCANDTNLSDVPPAQRTILKFALKCARSPNSMTDEDFERLYDNGLSQEEVMEVVMMAVFTNFINGWADASGIEVDGESA